MIFLLNPLIFFHFEKQSLYIFSMIWIIISLTLDFRKIIQSTRWYSSMLRRWIMSPRGLKNHRTSKNFPEMNVSRRVTIARHPVCLSMLNRPEDMLSLGGAFFSKTNRFFDHPWGIFLHPQGSKKNHRTSWKTSETNVSWGVHIIARYSVFYSAPNSHWDILILRNVCLFLQKIISWYT